MTSCLAPAGSMCGCRYNKDVVCPDMPKPTLINPLVDNPNIVIFKIEKRDADPTDDPLREGESYFPKTEEPPVEHKKKVAKLEEPETTADPGQVAIRKAAEGAARVFMRRSPAYYRDVAGPSTEPNIVKPTHGQRILNRRHLFYVMSFEARIPIDITELSVGLYAYSTIQGERIAKHTCKFYDQYNFHAGTVADYAKTVKIYPGKRYVFKGDLLIPNDLPYTLKHNRCSIEYFLKATLTIQNEYKSIYCAEEILVNRIVPSLIETEPATRTRTDPDFDEVVGHGENSRINYVMPPMDFREAEIYSWRVSQIMASQLNIFKITTKAIRRIEIRNRGISEVFVDGPIEVVEQLDEPYGTKAFEDCIRGFTKDQFDYKRIHVNFESLGQPLRRIYTKHIIFDYKLRIQFYRQVLCPPNCTPAIPTVPRYQEVEHTLYHPSLRIEGYPEDVSERACNDEIEQRKQHYVSRECR